jgi:transposase, IS30 family
MANYRQLNQHERDQIAIYLSADLSHREIGTKLGRNHRTISREIQRNSAKKGKDIQDSTVQSSYLPSKANALASYRKHTSKTSNLDNEAVKTYVIDKLQRHWSPEQISGRLKKKTPDKYVSTETIYKFIYEIENKQLKLWEYLRKSHKNRRSIFDRRIHRSKRLQIPNKISIKDRPLSANSRKVLGHYESDLMEGLKVSKDVVSATADRKSRVVYLDKLKNKESKKRIEKLSKRLSGKILESVTFDNGTENYFHEQIRKRYGINTYFCNAYHSWEKGTVENTIGLIRQYIPKKTDLSKVTQEDLDAVAYELNTRPRKCLDYDTPLEVVNSFSQVGHFS